MVEAGFRRSFMHGFVITFLKWFAIRVRWFPALYKDSRIKSGNDSISVFLVWLNLKFSEIFKLHTKVWYNNRVCKKEGWGSGIYILLIGEGSYWISISSHQSLVTKSLQPPRRSIMAKDYSFDVVCRTDLQEAANAVNQASKEIGTRYDFKGSKSSVTLAPLRK